MKITEVKTDRVYENRPFNRKNMARKAETVGGISADYDELNVMKTVLLPSRYIQYLERLRASSNGRFTSMTHMVKFALANTFPTPLDPNDEEEFVKKTFDLTLDTYTINTQGINFDGPSRSFKRNVSTASEDSGNLAEETLVYSYVENSGESKLFSGHVYRTSKSRKIRLDAIRNGERIFSHEFVLKDYDSSKAGRESFARGLALLALSEVAINTSSECDDLYELFDELLVNI